MIYNELTNIVLSQSKTLITVENNYEINDKQDLLAMCLIEFATKIKSQSQNYKKERSDISDDLNQINNILSEKLS